jgi:hypothetical protein
LICSFAARKFCYNQLDIQGRGAVVNQILTKAINEVSALSEDDQKEIALQILDLAARKRLDAFLAASEARGGSTPSDQVFRDLRSRLASC